MSKQIVVNSCMDETRVALLQDGTLTELHIEQRKRTGITGNIYKGKVTKVLPGMQACFVNIGQPRDAFLYASDIFDNLSTCEELADNDAEEEGNLIDPSCSCSPEESDQCQCSAGKKNSRKRRTGKKETAVTDEIPVLFEETGQQPDIFVDALEESAAVEKDSASERVCCEDRLVSDEEGCSPKCSGEKEQNNHADDPEETWIDAEVEHDGNKKELLLVDKRSEQQVPARKAESEGNAEASEQSPKRSRRPRRRSPGKTRRSQGASEKEAVDQGEQGNDVLAQEQKEGNSSPELADANQRPRRRSPRFRRGRNRGRQNNADRVAKLQIQNLVQEGQDVMVQVGKDSTGTKGARVTSLISLPGRFLVYMPHSSKVGISRRIEDPAERSRLKKIMEELRPATGGFIVRTAAGNKTKADFEADINFLTTTWEKILGRMETSKAPIALHEDLDLVLKTARDMLTSDVKKMILDDRKEYDRCRKFTQQYMERMSPRVKFFGRKEPIFERFQVESQIEKALRRKVWLKSGGYLVVDEAEALVAIDVNSGKYVGKTNLEDTVLKINLEAVKEVARQMKLRNLAGIIIIDLIDMEKEENQNKVMSALKKYLKEDRVRTNVHQLSDLGIVEMTRKRSRVSLGKKLLRDCPCCKGSGRIRSEQTMFGLIERDLFKMARKTDHEELIVRAHPVVVDLFYEHKEARLQMLQRFYNKKISVKSDHTMSYDQYDIMSA